MLSGEEQRYIAMSTSPPKHDVLASAGATVSCINWVILQGQRMHALGAQARLATQAELTRLHPVVRQPHCKTWLCIPKTWMIQT